MSARKTLTLKDKIDIINMIEGNECSASEIYEIYEIGSTEAYEIVNRKDEYQAQYSRGLEHKFKNSSNSEMNIRVWEWYVESRANNVVVNGPQIQKQARTIAKQLGYEGFRASNGWLQSFKIRHNIRFSAGGNRDESQIQREVQNAQRQNQPRSVNKVEITVPNVEYETIEIDGSDNDSSAEEDHNEIIEDDELVNESSDNQDVLENEKHVGMCDYACRDYQDVLDCIHRLQSFSVRIGDSRLLEMSTEMRNYVERNIYGE